MDWDTHRYFECFFAVPMLGAVLHTVNIRLAPAQIAYTIDHAEDDVILVHADFLPLLEEVMPLVKRDVRMILLRDNPVQMSESSFDFIASYDAMMTAPADDFVFPDFDERMRATTFYTTGTTGEPKAVAFSHRSWCHTMGLLPGWGQLKRQTAAGDVYMPITPMFHVHAWDSSMRRPRLASSRLCGSLYPGEPAAVDRRGGCHIPHCVPTILQMLLSAPEVANTDLSKPKMLIGGSALPRGLAEALARGINVYTGYGMSETCPVLTVSVLDPEDEASVEPRLKTGNPIPMVDLQTVGADGRNAA